MKLKTTILLLLLFIASSLFAQFSLQTEYFYLKLINDQQNYALISDNIKNSELTVNNITANLDTPNKYSTLYLTELANSHLFIENNSLALFYYLYQRCLFPNDSISTYQKKPFVELVYSLNLNDSVISSYWDITSKKNIPKNTNERIILLLKLTTQLHLDELSTPIYKLGLNLRKNNITPPTWYQHWEYLTMIGFKEKQKMEILKKEISGKRKIQVYSKAINYYLKNNSPKHAEELISQYRKEDLSIIRKFDVMLKLIRLKTIKMLK